MTPRTLVAETERLLLTRPQADDVAAVFALHGDPAAYPHNPHGPHRSPDESAALLRSMLDDWERDGVGYCAVARHEEPDVLIGFAGTRLTRLADVPVLNLHYRFAPSVWGHGLAGEAVGATLIVARRLFPDVPVVALMRDDNMSSRRLAERLGFRPLDGSEPLERAEARDGAEAPAGSGPLDGFEALRRFEDPEGRGVYVLPTA